MSEQTVGERLSEPFPAEMLRVNRAKNNITYVPIAEVTARLNRVLGVGNWSVKIVDRWSSGEIKTSKGIVPSWVMAHVRITAQVQPGEVYDPWVGDGVGGQSVKMRTDGSDAVDLGDEWKAAVSDATKKAVMSLGVALDLARKEEAMIAEMRIEQDLSTVDQQNEIRGLLARIADLPNGHTAAYEQRERLGALYEVPSAMTADDAANEIRTLREVHRLLLHPPEPPPERAREIVDVGLPGPVAMVEEELPDFGIFDPVPAPQRATDKIIAALAEQTPENAEMFEGWFLRVFQRPFNGGDVLSIEEAESAMDYLGITPEDTRS